jgi:hypothetical protein
MSIQKPYPFSPKDSSLGALKTVSKSQYVSSNYGTVFSGSDYAYSASITPELLISNHDDIKIKALKNTLNNYTALSNHYTYSSSLGDKSKQKMKLVSVPSIFYGSSIKKGSVSCKWYLTGTLIAELKDIKRNGELIQVGPSGSNGSGSCAGVILYNEGFVLLTGSWSLHNSYTDTFEADLTYYPPSWRYFLNTGSNGAYLTPSSSFDFEFEGVNYIQTLTMMAHAEKGELNHSNNPTYVKRDTSLLNTITSSNFLIENPDKQVKNILKTNYDEVDPKLEKIVYISQIGIYDENKNLIAIAKMANPVRKRQNDNYVFKMKIDI